MRPDVSVANGASATAMTGNKGEDGTANAPNSAIKIRRVIPEAKVIRVRGWKGRLTRRSLYKREVELTSGDTTQEFNHEF